MNFPKVSFPNFLATSAEEIITRRITAKLDELETQLASEFLPLFASNQDVAVVHARYAVARALHLYTNPGMEIDTTAEDTVLRMIIESLPRKDIDRLRLLHDQAYRNMVRLRYDAETTGNETA